MARARYRVCIRCPTLHEGTGMCPTCRSAADAERGSPADRGYDAKHRAERRRWEPVVAAGVVRCARCREFIEAGEPWDLGHNEDRTAWTGPEHASENRAAGARKANAQRARY